MQEKKFEFPKFLIEKYKEEISKGGEFYCSDEFGKKAENIETKKTYIISIRKKDSENNEIVYVGGLRTSPTESGRLEPDGVGCFFNTNDLKYGVTLEKHVNGKKVYQANYALPDEEPLNLLTFYEDCCPAHFFYNEEQIVDYVYGIVSNPFDEKKFNPEMDETLIYKDYFRLGIWEELFSCCNAKAMKKSEIYEMIEKCFSKCEESNPSFRIGYFRDKIKEELNLNYEYLKQNLQGEPTTFNLEGIDNLSRSSK